MIGPRPKVEVRGQPPDPYKHPSTTAARLVDVIVAGGHNSFHPPLPAEGLSPGESCSLACETRRRSRYAWSSSAASSFSGARPISWSSRPRRTSFADGSGRWSGSSASRLGRMLLREVGPELHDEAKNAPPPAKRSHVDMALLADISGYRTLEVLRGAGFLARSIIQGYA